MSREYKSFLQIIFFKDSQFLNQLNILNIYQAMTDGKSGSIWYIHKHGDEPLEVAEQFPTFDHLLNHNSH